jgi:hypothetical protein
MVKKFYYFISFALLALALSNFASAETCGGVEAPYEHGVCRDSCVEGEHPISGSCIQVCCAEDGSGETCNAQCNGENAHFATSCNPENEFGISACPDVPGKEFCCVASGSGSDNPCSEADDGTICIDNDLEISGTCKNQVCVADDTEGDEEDDTQTTSGWSTGNYADLGLPGGTITGIISNLIFWILSIFGMIAIIGFAISGIMYLTSAGNDTQIESAKKAMKWSLVGVVVGLIGLVILFAVTNLLGGLSSTF